MKDLAVRARSKKIKPEEYQGGTITISNLGAYGVDSFYAIVNPPQATILAVGAIVKKPVVNAANQIVAGQRMNISLSGDHRVVDGATGAEFLAAIRKSLEAPASLLLEYKTKDRKNLLSYLRSTARKLPRFLQLIITHES